MTRSIVLVNTSNWDGEDYDVTATATVAGAAVTAAVERVPPGGRLWLPSSHRVGVAIEPVDSKTPEPFLGADGVQVTPELPEVEWYSVISPTISRGQKAVRASFNPSQSSDVDQIKAAAAALYDTIEKHVPGCADRTVALRTVVQASMWAVYAATDQ